MIKESDNNVKLIVLDRLDTLRSKHGHVLDGLIMDVLQTLTRLVSSHNFFRSDSRGCVALILRSAEKQSTLSSI